MLPVERASGFLYYIHGSGWRELIRGFKYRGAWRTARAMGEWYGRCLKESGLYDGVEAVSYTHLDVYKRQRLLGGDLLFGGGELYVRLSGRGACFRGLFPLRDGRRFETRSRVLF